MLRQKKAERENTMQEEKEKVKPEAKKGEAENGGVTAAPKPPER